MTRGSVNSEEAGQLTTMPSNGPSTDYSCTPSMMFAVSFHTTSPPIGMQFPIAHGPIHMYNGAVTSAGPSLTNNGGPIFYTSTGELPYPPKVYFTANTTAMSQGPPIPTMIFINDSTKNAYSQSTMSKTSVHGNGHSIGLSGQKKNATTATGKSTSKHQQKQHRSGINKRTDKNYEHPWLMTTLKGHTDQVYDIDFSSNGKYLASCSEATSMQDSADGDAGDENTSSSSSSSEDSPKQHRLQRNSAITGCTTKTGRTMSRRQRKNRKSLSNSSDCSSTTIDEKENKEPMSSGGQRKNTKSRGTNLSKKRPTALPEIHRLRALTPPLRVHLKLNLSEDVLVSYLQKYTLRPYQLREMGFPFEYGDNQVALIKVSIPDIHGARDTVSGFDVNAREFVPRISSGTQRFYKELVIVNQDDGLKPGKFADDDSNALQLSGDSGQGSGSSSPPSVDSDSNDIGDDVVLYQSNTATTNGYQQINNGISEYFQKECVRCKKQFFVTDRSQYLTNEHCIYHWGRRERVFKNGTFISMYSCCGSVEPTKGCTFGELHVWTGINDGFNGPLDGFVITQPAKVISTDGNYGIYAVDCEMSFTVNGLELTKVTLVNSSGALVYETLVKPVATIIDYNTRFSGITEKDLAAKNGSVKSLKEVQNDLLQIICAETILIGHALENDLRALKLIHNNVIDTSNLFPHTMGLPYRRSLKSLTKSILKRDIQTLERGHCSFEDSRASLELLLWVVRNEIRSNM